MLPPHGDAAGLTGLPEVLAISTDASAERLERRNAALQRQLEVRIAQVADLQARLDELGRVGNAGAAEAELLRAKADEYNALMATLTMRALRRPRGWYTAARRCFSTLAGRRPGRHS